jgi:hypothetical protein
MHRMTPWELATRLRYRDPAKPTPAEVRVRKNFIARYPDQEANILTLQTDPGCKCQGDLFRRVTGDATTLNPQLKDIFELSEDATMVIPRNLVGDIMIIPDTEADFKELMNTCQQEHWAFKGFAMLKDGDNIKLYFY